MRFLDLAATSASVAAVSGRKAKIDLLAGALRRLAPDEIAAGSAYLAGELRQRQTGVGYAGLRDLPAPTAEPMLSVKEVDARIAEISVVAGAGSQARRRELVGALFARATVDEQRLLVGLFGGELRQGAQAGLLADAIARAAEVPPAAVRRALLLSGDLKQVAVAALGGGAPALAEFRLRVGTPLTPMLAASAPDVAAALLSTGSPAVADVKLDGIRIQVHRSGDEIAVFTRSLDDITSRLPGVVAAVRALPVREVVLDGEAMAMDAAGRPRPFQEISSRAATRAGSRRRRTSATPDEGGSDSPAVGNVGMGGAAAGDVGMGGGGTGGAGGGDAGLGVGAGDELRPYFFDLLHRDGTHLLDEPGRVRWAALADALPADLIVGRRTVETAEQAAEAFAAAVAAGQEGLVIKAPEAPYDVGRRGSAWVKVKPRHTLDLVVLAVEWGHGRRRGWLSNLHLGARDPRTGEFVMLGKTFKGLTDELLRWQTERFRSLAVDDNGWVVTVRPEQVVEIAFDGVQTSPRYPGGVALRFARVLRYRDDKRAEEADTIDMVKAIGAPMTSEAPVE
ncbi:ATP-dependent DNA ligase [Actinoplanes sp. N902-109]|uniref:ATP-dependent DNA ligase n=1 Tax=Actinoplanes sp. (strain N902-109) TaxID=649831 RepID=UPI0003294AED|nr:ATP-dependent DNA ligase [Actinoplanes sp. N902-109]AGL14939.1 DNA ligase i, ATP-dependent dnl1 [Actinoplanes sp. N902-109]